MPTARFTGGAAALVILVVAYAVLGGPGFARDTVRSRVYLLLAWSVVLLLTVAAYQAGSIVAVVLIAQTWATLDRWPASVVTTVAMIALAVATWASLGWGI